MEKDLIIVRGDDKIYRLQFQADGEAVDLTGAKVMFTAKTKVSDSDENAVLRINQTEHTDAPGGRTEIALTNTDTKIPAGEYFYDIQIVTAENKVHTILRGKLSIVYEITERIAADD